MSIVLRSALIMNIGGATRRARSVQRCGCRAARCRCRRLVVQLDVLNDALRREGTYGVCQGETG